MDKVYTRTLTMQGTTSVDTVTRREGLDEINDAMMRGRRFVRTMSQISRTDFAIDYKDGRKVRLVLTDAPATPKPERTAVEPMDWASTRTGNVEHRFDADGRARCNRRLRAYDRYVSQTDRRVRRTRSEIESGPYADQYTFCPKCSAL